MSEYTAEYMVAHNSHELTAHQLVTARREMVELSRGHDAAIASVRAQLTDAERIGLAVMRAHRAGRKTVRIAELIEKETGR